NNNEVPSMSSNPVAKRQPNIFFLIFSITVGILHAADPKPNQFSVDIERHFPCSFSSASIYLRYKRIT
ncbi:unnamed protein product, partial [Onchocerca ochengi]